MPVWACYLFCVCSRVCMPRAERAWVAWVRQPFECECVCTCAQAFFAARIRSRLARIVRIFLRSADKLFPDKFLRRKNFFAYFFRPLGELFRARRNAGKTVAAARGFRVSPFFSFLNFRVVGRRNFFVCFAAVLYFDAYFFGGAPLLNPGL